ncbi:MAG: TauD/TfdA family dioxygenase [Acidobacteria bacterium]|nr:TauD/TfdA family dioxygenase [Acidobacteriota bacterium]
MVGQVSVSEKMHAMFDRIKIYSHFPAEVYIDQPFPEWGDEFKEDLRALLRNHHVLILRGLELAPADQVIFTSIFGDVAKPWDNHRTHPETALVQVVSNASRKESYKSVTLHWHSDESFTSRPTEYTVLHALMVPSSGGDTLFADLHAAYRDYGEAAKRPLARLKAVHSFRLLMGPMVAARISPEAARSEEERFPDVRHPLVRTIPGTNQKAFFLNQLCVSYVEPLTATESTNLLNSLYTHCLQDMYIYSHKWRVRDTVIWDNSCLLHRVANIPANEPRVLHRTTTSGQIPQGCED